MGRQLISLREIADKVVKDKQVIEDVLTSSKYSQAVKLMKQGKVFIRLTKKPDDYFFMNRTTKRPPKDTPKQIDDAVEKARRDNFPSYPSRQNGTFCYPMTISNWSKDPIYGSNGYCILPMNGFKIFQHPDILDFWGSEPFNDFKDEGDEKGLIRYWKEGIVDINKIQFSGMGRVGPEIWFTGPYFAVNIVVLALVSGTGNARELLKWLRAT